MRSALYGTGVSTKRIKNQNNENHGKELLRRGKEFD